MRLNDKGERIHFDWKQIMTDQAEIKLLAVSNKKNIQRAVGVFGRTQSTFLDVGFTRMGKPEPDVTQSLDLSTLHR